MKIIAIRRKRTVLATAGLLVAVLAVAGVSLAWTGHHHYRLGGGWIGSGSGSSWNCLTIPLDPAGQKSTVRVNIISYVTNFAEVLAYSGADTVADYVGEGEMISGDTAKFTMVSYGLKQGNPPEIRQIWVDTGTWKYTGLDSADLNFNLALYPAAADANGDGFPDPGATPFMTITNLTASAKRVPLP